MEPFIVLLTRLFSPPSPCYLYAVFLLLSTASNPSLPSLSYYLPSTSLFLSPTIFLLFTSLTLTLQRVFCTEVTRYSFPTSLSLLLSGGKSHTHQFASSVPDEQARKENINEAPQPINT